MHKRFLMRPFLILVLLSASALRAQIETTLSQYGEENGKPYMRPLIESFGFGLNRGLWQDAGIPKSGLHVKIGLAAVSVAIPKAKRFYTATTQGDFSPQQTVETSTIFGPNEATKVDGQGGTAYSFPGGLNLEAVAVGAPQMTIGSLLGTEVMARYIAVDLTDSEIGQLKLMGAGVRHSLSQYFPSFPVDMAIGGFWQNLKVGDDLIDITTTQVSLQASKRMSVLLLYASAGYEMSSGSVKYTFKEADVEETLDYDIEGKKSAFVTAGGALKLSVLTLFADFTVGAYQAMGLGLNIGF